LLHVSYDGSGYSGFAAQTNAQTVANVLTSAIASIDPEAGLLTCASRTDAGVHATGQPVSFSTTKPLKTRGWVLALAQRLPKDISVTRASFVPLDFDPRVDPLYKIYHYRVLASQVEDPLVGRVAWRVGQPLDVELMRSEARLLEGEHDFVAFRSGDDTRRETVRRLHRVTVKKSDSDPRILDIVVQGNRFMYNMVRIIAGTLVDIGRTRVQSGAFERAFASGDRRDLGMTAPPHGLTLVHVELKTSGSDAWPPM
jgi:tRNA pseudouridine38-40 synthase